MSVSLMILLLLLTLICSAFFSGMEIAFISANRLDVELAGKKRGRLGQILQNFKNQSSRFIGATLLGNNLALVFFGLLITDLLEPWLGSWLPKSLVSDFPLLLIITIISTIIILFAGEFIPKNLFRNNPVGKLIFGLPLFLPVYYICYIPVTIIDFISRAILGKEEQEGLQEMGLSRVDVENYLERMKENISEDEEKTTDIFNKTLKLNNVKARECIVPRNEVLAVEKSTPISEIRQSFIKSRFSKILVYDDSIDQAIGYYHHLDILQETNINPPIHKLPIFPEAKPVRDILQHFIKTRKSIALIVDEFGGTAGIVSMEDIVEEIFGEIEDEHDDSAVLHEKISDTEFLLSGRCEIDLLNEEYDLKLPEGDYETVAGFILHHTERIPDIEEKIDIEPFSFLVEEVTATKIESVRLFVEEES